MYYFRVWTHGLENNSSIYLSCITIATQGGIFNQIFYKNNYKFFRYAHHVT